MNYLKRGDIVWLNDNLSIRLGRNVQSISRPYVVISNNTNNKFSPTVNLACLSKQTKKSNYPMHVLLDKRKYNLEFDSVIFAEQIMTVNKNEIVEVVDSLDNEDLAKLNKALYIQLITEKPIASC